jgi:hypothetical protein
MPDVLGVAAFELSHPVLRLVLMETDNAALHSGALLASRPLFSGAVGRIRGNGY